MSKKFSIILNKKLDRNFIITSYPNGLPFNICMTYNKNTVNMQFQFSTTTEEELSKGIYVRSYRNLRKCPFCQLYFELGDKETDLTSYAGYIKNYSSLFNKQVDIKNVELYDFNFQHNKDFDNYIKVTEYRLKNMKEEHDLIFYFFERKMYNIDKKMEYIRTTAIQLSNVIGLKQLVKNIKDYNFNIKSLDKRIVLEDDLETIGVTRNIGLTTIEQSVKISSTNNLPF